MKTLFLLGVILASASNTVIGTSYTFQNISGDPIFAVRGVQDYEYEQGWGITDGPFYDYFGVRLETSAGTYEFGDIMNHGGTFTLSADRAVLLSQNLGVAHMGPFNFFANFQSDSDGLTSWCASYLVTYPDWTEEWKTACGTGIFLRSDLPFVHEVSIASPDSGQTIGLLAMAFLSVIGFYKSRLA